MELHFCESWFDYEKKMIEPITEQKARKLEKAGKPYTVIIGNPECPFGFVVRNSNTGYYGVFFLDKHKRVYSIYSFQETEGGMLFLSKVIFREFDGESDNVIRGTMYLFKQDGQVTIDEAEHPFNKVERIEKKCDIRGNWEMKPEFGKYEGLLKKERNVKFE